MHHGHRLNPGAICGVMWRLRVCGRLRDGSWRTRKTLSVHMCNLHSRRLIFALSRAISSTTNIPPCRVSCMIKCGRVGKCFTGAATDGDARYGARLWVSPGPRGPMPAVSGPGKNPVTTSNNLNSLLLPLASLRPSRHSRMRIHPCLRTTRHVHVGRAGWCLPTDVCTCIHCQPRQQLNGGLPGRRSESATPLCADQRM